MYIMSHCHREPPPHVYITLTNTVNYMYFSLFMCYYRTCSCRMRSFHVKKVPSISNKAQNCDAKWNPKSVSAVERQSVYFLNTHKIHLTQKSTYICHVSVNICHKKTRYESVRYLCSLQIIGNCWTNAALGYLITITYVEVPGCFVCIQFSK